MSEELTGTLFCGAKVTKGHGDSAVCGEYYYDSTYQCDACKIKELQAELSALKAQQVGQEPAGEVHLRTGGGISLLHVELAQSLPPGTKLYTAPQPAPAQDVAKLVYALQRAKEWLEGWASAEPQLVLINAALAAHDKQSGGEV